MDEYEETPLLGIGLSTHQIPEDEPVLYLETASAQSFEANQQEEGFEYTAAWQHDIDENGFEELFNEYATEGELFEARTPRTLLGYRLPLTKKVGEIGVNQEEPRHQADYFQDGTFMVSTDSTNTDPLRYYFPETVQQDLQEPEILQILEEAEDTIEDDAGMFHD